MKKHVFFLIISCSVYIEAAAQTTDQIAGKQPSNAKSNAVAFGISFPLGVFGRIHVAGPAIDYSRSHRRYGRDVSHSKLIGFMLNAGASYYPGEKITTAGYEFRYGGYFYLHIMAGIDYKPAMNMNIALTAGPTLGIYKGGADAGFGVNLFLNYYLSKNITIGPCISYKKHANADALWSGTIRASYIF